MMAARPNILLIMLDQMRTPRWFPKHAALPAYERLNREGLCSDVYAFLNRRDVVFYSRTMPPEDCVEVCDALLDKRHAGLASQPRVQALYQRFRGRILRMPPDPPEALWQRYGDCSYHLTQ